VLIRVKFVAENAGIESGEVTVTLRSRNPMKTHLIVHVTVK
jgi:hypothetical protein